ncbi:hypothetical protein COLO4_09202 [Corchorus olitorius]|uniref:Uncharacterized protein n=1 Tax=Corchorus olitorius TaxID=93759 RepID=A0A1R3KD05_9ROSI|nr:hypothetical protein COLO4_09202 [Corchorus olitorius]
MLCVCPFVQVETLSWLGEGSMELRKSLEKVKFLCRFLDDCLLP